LFQQSKKNVLHIDLLMPLPRGERLCLRYGLLGLLSKPIEIHFFPSAEIPFLGISALTKTHSSISHHPNIIYDYNIVKK
jgi:hypothetical protein